jgi:serine protease Do
VDFSKIASGVTPAVVSITSTELVQKGFRNPLEEFFPEYFNVPRDEMEKKIPRSGAGSGFIIDREGYILTNNHVIQDAVEIEVRLDEERRYTAEVVGSDDETDIALIKIDPGDDELPVLPLGDSDKVQVGEWVMAVGNPAIQYLLDRTVTVGVISGKGRKRLVNISFDDFLQTDAAINFGNSGGPLVNASGEVIGINTLILAHTEGLGFSIPINKAKQIIPELKSEGKVSRGWLGISISDVTAKHKKAFGLDVDHGVLVQDVFPDAPAGKAGLKRGDIIIRVDQQEIKNAEELVEYISAKKPGTDVKVTVIRDGKKKSNQVTLAERGQPTVEETEENKETKEEVFEKMGLTVEEISPQMRLQHDFLKEGVEGVIVTDVKPLSPAYKSGIRHGDVIQEINREKISDLTEFQQKITDALKDDIILFYILRDDVSSFVIVELE